VGVIDGWIVWGFEGFNVCGLLEGRCCEGLMSKGWGIEGGCM